MWTAFNRKRSSSTNPHRRWALLVAVAAFILPVAAYLEAGDVVVDQAKTTHKFPQSTYEGQRRKSSQKPRLAGPVNRSSDLTVRRNSMPKQIAGLPTVRAELEVVRHRSRLIVARSRIKRTSVADSSIAQIVQYTPEEISVIGMAAGSTTLTLWFEDESEPLIYLVKVFEDPTLAGLPQDVDYPGLERKLAVLFPHSQVALVPLSGRVIVKGEVSSQQEAQSILQIIRGETSRPLPQEAPQAATFRNTRLARRTQTEIVNLLEVRSQDHVKLYVRVVEIDRALLRQMGLNLNRFVDRGRPWVPLGDGHRSGALAGLFESGEVDSLMSQLGSCGALKGFSEPTLTVLSGHSAGFLSGGEFALPTPIGSGGNTQTIPGFGTSLIVVPTVTGPDRVRLRIMPEFQDSSVFAADGSSTPGRKLETTVELREGQTIALTGLVRRHMNAHTSRRPFLGSIPVVGSGFNETWWSQSETELLILVSPEIISRHPTSSAQRITPPSIASPSLPAIPSPQYQPARPQQPIPRNVQHLPGPMSVGRSLADQIIQQVNRNTVRPQAGGIQYATPPTVQPNFVPDISRRSQVPSSRRSKQAARTVPTVRRGKQKTSTAPTAPILFQPSDEHTTPSDPADASAKKRVETKPQVEQLSKEAPTSVAQPIVKQTAPTAAPEVDHDAAEGAFDLDADALEALAETLEPWSTTSEVETEAQSSPEPVDTESQPASEIVDPPAATDTLIQSQTPPAAVSMDPVAAVHQSHTNVLPRIPPHGGYGQPQPRQQVKATIPNLDRHFAAPVTHVAAQQYSAPATARRDTLRPAATGTGRWYPGLRPQSGSTGQHVGPSQRQVASPLRPLNGQVQRPAARRPVVQQQPGHPQLRPTAAQTQSVPQYQPPHSSVARQPAPHGPRPQTAQSSQVQTRPGLRPPVATAPIAPPQRTTAHGLHPWQQRPVPATVSQPRRASAIPHQTLARQSPPSLASQQLHPQSAVPFAHRPIGQPAANTRLATQPGVHRPSTPTITQHQLPIGPGGNPYFSGPVPSGRTFPPPTPNARGPVQYLPQVGPVGHPQSAMVPGPTVQAVPATVGPTQPHGVGQGPELGPELGTRPEIETAGSEASSSESPVLIPSESAVPSDSGGFGHEPNDTPNSVSNLEQSVEAGPMTGPILMAPDSQVASPSLAPSPAGEDEGVASPPEPFVGPQLIWTDAVPEKAAKAASETSTEIKSEEEDDGALPLIVPRTPVRKAKSHPPTAE